MEGISLADAGSSAEAAIMVGDDIEGDVGGGLGSGIASVLVKTGKYRSDLVAETEIEPTATIDSIADLPGLIAAGSGSPG